MSTDTTRSRQSFYQTSSGNNSLADLSYVTDDVPPPLPRNPSIHYNNTTHKTKKSIDTLSSGFTSGQMPSPITRSRSPHDFPPIPSQTQAQQTQPQSQLKSRPSQIRTFSNHSVSQVGRPAESTTQSAHHPPKTPPRSASLMLRVVNDPLSQSPPPAYRLDGPLPVTVEEKPPLAGSESLQPQQPTPQPQLRKTSSTQRQADGKPRASVLSTSTVTPASVIADQSTDQQDAFEISDTGVGDEEAEGEDEDPISLPPLELGLPSLSMSPPVPAKKKKRYSLVPPRLSLGQDAFADIGSWGDGLFDSLSDTAPHPSTKSESTDKSAPVILKVKLEKSLNPSSSTKEKEEREKGEKESSGPRGPTTTLSLAVSPPLAATTQATHQPSQPLTSQTQAQSQTLLQSQSGPIPPPKTVSAVPFPQPPVLSASISSSSTASSSSSQSKTRVRSATKATNPFTPSPTPSPPRGRTGHYPSKSGDSSLSKTTTSTNASSKSPPPRERSSSRTSAVHRPLPPQKPLPTLSLMSPIPLPNPPSHAELKSKVSTVSLKAAAKRDKEREKAGEKEKEADKVGKVGDVGKKDNGPVRKGKGGTEKWPMTAKETVALMASINHDNDGLDFGKKDERASALPSLKKKASSASLDPHDSCDITGSHLSVDSTKLDPNRLSSTSAGSRGSTQSNSGGALKLIIDGDDSHNDNRDSNVSTATITNATIVSGPVEVATRARADLVVSPATSSGEPHFGVGTGSRETTPRQATPPGSDADAAVDDDGSRVGPERRSPSPGSSAHSHSSSDATAFSSTGPSSLSSTNKAVEFARPVIKRHSGWESEEGATRIAAPSSSSSPSTSPHKPRFDDESADGEDDDDGDDCGIEVGDEEGEDEDEEEAVITVVSPPSGSQKGSITGLMPGITGQRRPSLVNPSLTSCSLTSQEPSVSQVLSPLNCPPHLTLPGVSPPVKRYSSWVSDVLSEVDLETFVDQKVEPRDYFEGLTEVAEGESGFVYQAKVIRTVPASKLTKGGPQPGAVVAIKAVPILPSGSTKLEDLRREVEVMKKIFEDDRLAGASHALIMEAMYVDLQEDALWIRMELMERSLADVVALVEEGRLERLDEKVVARFASDVSSRLFVILFCGKIDHFVSFF